MRDLRRAGLSYCLWRCGCFKKRCASCESKKKRHGMSFRGVFASAWSCRYGFGLRCRIRCTVAVESLAALLLGGRVIRVGLRVYSASSQHLRFVGQTPVDRLALVFGQVLVGECKVPAAEKAAMR